MNDQRSAEWLSLDDASFGEDSGEPAPGGGSGETLGGAGDRTAARPATIPTWRRVPDLLGLEGQEARLHELVSAMGRRIRRRPLTAMAVGVAAGFVIGGALSFRAGRILLTAGARHVARELLKQLL